MEQDIRDIPNADQIVSYNDGDTRVDLKNVTVDTLIKVYYKMGVKDTSPKYSLRIDVQGPGSKDPNIRTSPAMMNLSEPASNTYNVWAELNKHKVTMVMVDGMLRPDLIDNVDAAADKFSYDVPMNVSDATKYPDYAPDKLDLRDHNVILFLDVESIPELAKTVDNGGKAVLRAGDELSYSVIASNDTDYAIWGDKDDPAYGVYMTDALPEGLDYVAGSAKVYMVDDINGSNPVENAALSAKAAQAARSP